MKALNCCCDAYRISNGCNKYACFKNFQMNISCGKIKEISNIPWKNGPKTNLSLYIFLSFEHNKKKNKVKNKYSKMTSNQSSSSGSSSSSMHPPQVGEERLMVIHFDDHSVDQDSYGCDLWKLFCFTGWLLIRLPFEFGHQLI